MEITLEKIEMVKDRTGVSYKEAKDALEKADGSVVDAIIEIEENIDSSYVRGNTSSSIADKLKELIRKGNASKIVVKKDDDTLINLPVNAGIIGAFLSPVGCAVGIAAAFGFKCSIEIEKHDGTRIDVSDAAKETIDTVVEKGSAAAGAAKEKATETFGAAKEMASEKFETAKDKASETFESAKDKASETLNKAKDKASETISNAKEKMEEKREAGDMDIDFSGCFGEDDEIGDTI